MYVCTGTVISLMSLQPNRISHILKHFVILVIVDFDFPPVVNVGRLEAATARTESTGRSV